LIYGEKHEFTAWQQDWEKNEYLVDFLLKHTQIANLIPQYQGTLQTLKSYELGEYAIESKKYLEELGFFTQSRLCKIEGKIQIDSNIMSGLTKSQFDLLSLLIEKRNQLVTFDEIGKVLWQNDFTEKYSPWAIAKHIQGLREKLRLVGLNSNSIQTYRKQGVVLYD
jgi:DNA-binding response OmpR family regulator